MILLANVHTFEKVKLREITNRNSRSEMNVFDIGDCFDPVIGCFSQLTD